MPPLPDVSAEHKEAAACHGFKWRGQREALPEQLFAAVYGAEVWRRPRGFKMRSEDGRSVEKYRVGAFVSVNVISHPGAAGDAGASSIAKIADILEDGKGCCHVALAYFWRWGQIHAGADQGSSEATASAINGRPATALTWEAELFLQAPVARRAVPFDEGGALDDSGLAPRSANLLRHDDGSWRDVVPALHLNHLVVVRPYAEVLAGEGGLQAYEARYAAAREECGARKDGFWWRTVFDPTSYTFEEVQSSVPRKLLSESERGMSDMFCGAGTVAVAARSCGWAVQYGVDADRDAFASFRANTKDPAAAGGGGGFNPEPFGSCRPLHMTVQQLLQQLRSGELSLPHAGYMHLSPPCQNLSNMKALSTRLLDVVLSDWLTVVDLIATLQPTFVTMEEVPGFLQQTFVKQPGTKKRPAAGSDNSGSNDSEQDDEDSNSNDVLDSEHNAPSAKKPGKFDFRTVLVSTSRLLSLGYQVRLCLLNAVHYGAPQGRWRVFLFAAQSGYQLPQPPAPRYRPPLSLTAPFATERDPTLMPRGGSASTWFDVLTSHLGDAQQMSELPLHVNIAEAIGDLPLLLCSDDEDGSSSGSSAGGSPRGPGNSGAAVSQTRTAAASSRLQQQHRQRRQPPAGTPAPAPKPASTPGRQSRPAGGSVRGYGFPAAAYDPTLGSFLTPLPGPAESQWRPVSAYAEWSRSLHWEGQQLPGAYDPRDVTDHTITAGQVRRGRAMSPSDLVPTVIGQTAGQGACCHFDEPRLASILERRRFQSVPDWFQYLGQRCSVQKQIGNAVPYVLGAEVAASVWEAATGQPGRRPPSLAGPSPAGVGLPPAELPAYQEWRSSCDAVAASRAALQACLARRARAGRGAAKAAAADSPSDSKSIDTDDGNGAAPAAADDDTSESSSSDEDDEGNGGRGTCGC